MVEKLTHTRIPRPPVITVMGHVDHGKSTLLDHIRKTNVVAGEAGGITQHLSAYEVVHETSGGTTKRMTFLDTPGHEAFAAMRARGAKVADVAVLVVAADDGVKAQTEEALRAITDAGVPFVVAINKVDKPEANVDRVKQELAGAGVYLEGYGGNVSFVPISAKKGDGVPELLDLIILAAELEELTGDPEKPAEGVVIEVHVEPKKGICATLIITEGTLRTGSYVVAGGSFAPTRIMENFRGERISEATFSSPVRIIGFTTPPSVGAPFVSSATKKSAEEIARRVEIPASKRPEAPTQNEEQSLTIIPFIVKTDVSGTQEAVIDAITKLETPHVKIKFLHTGVGSISENDVRLAGGDASAVIVGFNVPVESSANELVLRAGVSVAVFDVIYRLTEWVASLIAERQPKRSVDERKGLAKVLRTFSRTRERQIVGGEVMEGSLTRGAHVKILRRDAEIGRGKIVELQQQKIKTDRVDAENQFGAQIETRIEIAPGDRIESFETVIK